MRRQFVLPLLLLILLLWLGRLAVPSWQRTGSAMLASTSTRPQMDSIRSTLIYIDTHLPAAVEQRSELAQGRSANTEYSSMTGMQKVCLGDSLSDTSGEGSSNDPGLPPDLKALRQINEKLEKEGGYRCK